MSDALKDDAGVEEIPAKGSTRKSGRRDVADRFEEIDGLFGDDLAEQARSDAGKRKSLHASAFASGSPPKKSESGAFSQFTSPNGATASSGSNGSSSQFPGLMFVEYVAPCKRPQCKVCRDARTRSKEPIAFVGSIDDVGATLKDAAGTDQHARGAPAPPESRPTPRPRAPSTRPNRAPEPHRRAPSKATGTGSRSDDDLTLSNRATFDASDSSDGLGRHGSRPFIKAMDPGDTDRREGDTLESRLDQLLARAARVGFKRTGPPPSGRSPSDPKTGGRSP